MHSWCTESGPSSFLCPPVVLSLRCRSMCVGRVCTQRWQCMQTGLNPALVGWAGDIHVRTESVPRAGGTNEVTGRGLYPALVGWTGDAHGWSRYSALVGWTMSTDGDCTQGSKSVTQVCYIPLLTPFLSYKGLCGFPQRFERPNNWMLHTMFRSDT